MQNRVENGREEILQPAMHRFNSRAMEEQADNSSALLNGVAEDLQEAASVSTKAGVVNKIRYLHTDAELRRRNCLDRLNRLGIPNELVQLALRRSEQTGAWIVHELVSAGHLSAGHYFRQVATDLGLDFCETIEIERIVREATPPLFRVGRNAQVCCRNKDGQLVIHAAPDSLSEAVIAETIAKFPNKKSAFRIVAPETVRKALEKMKAAGAAEASTRDLYLKTPQMSAKFTLVPWQAFLLGMFVLGLPVAAFQRPSETFLFLHVMATMTFALATATRFAAYLGLMKKRRKSTAAAPAAAGYPMYTVLVALHKEAAVAPQIVKSMSMLDWPQSRLDVVYVCEEDDIETQEALTKVRLPPSHRILLVPPIGPRTKPKALNFALAQSSGELVVIYDAEDRPHPLQLKEAWQRFCGEGPDLACLQAPLLVTNAGQGWIPCLFAAEYACHFQGLLPYLDYRGAPLPLGGTSNHFRREALEKVSAWDPYNVTEDADLGIRFFRYGYRCSLIHKPTLEDSPQNLSEWIPQRTRWIKGWMQTFFVHNREIGQLKRNIGLQNLILFEILMIGFIMSPIFYTISILGFILISLNLFSIDSSYYNVIWIDLSVFFAGHLTYLALCAAAWHQAFQTRLPLRAALTFPAYWALASFAAWRAVWKLIRHPFEWEKTRHKPSTSPAFFRSEETFKSSKT